MSCPSPGNCGAAGWYQGGPESGNEPFVVNQHNGRWETAIEVPGIAALNVADDSRAFTISCASAGNCVAGGNYVDADSRTEAFVASAKWQAFVVTERNSRWGNAQPVLPTPSIADNVPGAAGVESVSCPPVGGCTASGNFLDRSGRLEAFVVSQRKGKWGTAVTIRGIGALNGGGAVDALSVSCLSAGNCAVGGFYTGRHGHAQAFVANERNGRWDNATEVPGFGRLNRSGDGAVFSVSCAAIGQCSAGGIYKSHGRHQAFVVSQTGK
ncbi:MAG TPA: hypothetical protein VFI65_32270 [Streptosporangiaceae bacterium]|nr:hypothetical protein [Streptosporangiaceae bacterium]